MEIAPNGSERLEMPLVELKKCVCVGNYQYINYKIGYYAFFLQFL